MRSRSIFIQSLLGHCQIAGTIEKLDFTGSTDGRDERAIDPARRFARYGQRLEAEGLKRSLSVIDRAIDDAADDPEGES